MNRRGFFGLVAASAGITALGGCGDREAEGATVEKLRLGDTVNETNPGVAAERFFAQRVAALTNGRYEVEVFPAGALGDHNKMNTMVRSGTLHFTKSFFGNLGVFDSRLGVLSLPYVFTDRAKLFAALDGDLGRTLTGILDTNDLTVLAYFDAGARNIYNRKRPVQTPADLKGLRIRVPQDSISLDMVNLMGAKAIPLATNDIQSALNRGTIDGLENSPVFYVTNGHVAEVPYFSWTRHQHGVDALLASKVWLSSLPSEVRDAVLAAGKETQAMERDLWETETTKYAAQAVTEGALFNDNVDVAAFRKAVQPIYTKHWDVFGELMKLIPD